MIETILNEIQKAMEMNLEGKNCKLNAYRRYCDRAADLLETMLLKVSMKMNC